MSHLKGLMVRRDHFPTMSQMTAALLAVVSICKRVFCIVIYFTPPLGLFSLLRHLQAEQTKYYFAFDNYRKENFVNNEGMIEFGDSSPFLWSTVDRWDRITNTAPDYTLYSIFTLKTYFWAFWVIFICHVLTIYGVKKRVSQGFAKRNLLNKICHCLNCLNIPFPIEDWDVGLGNALEHFNRLKACRKENLLVILTNSFYNLLLIVPIFCLGKSKLLKFYSNLPKFYSKSPLSATKISERHDILYNTVGYLPEEQTAYVYVWIIAGISIPLLILSTILEVFLSITYNETVHPFRNIVVDIKPNAEEQNFPLNLINPM